MTFSQINLAVPAIQCLIAQQLPLSVSYKLYKLSIKINEELKFCAQKETEIRSRYTDLSDAGLAEELGELFTTESDLQVEPIDIRLDSDLKLSVIDIGNLEGFINFIE